MIRPLSLLRMLASGAACLLPSLAVAGTPTLTPLAQFQGSDAWDVVGHIASLGTSIIGAAGGSGTVNLFSPGATSSAAWINTPIYRFGPITSDGAYPSGGVVVSAGHVFGSTSGGGNAACANGCGTVFELTAPATGTVWTETQLAVFGNDNNGYVPADTVLVKGGTVYGTAIHAANDTTRAGGTAPVGGVVFQLTKPASGTGLWTETVLHHFDAASGDGDTPFGGLILGPNKTLIGTTFSGGACNQGTVYQLTPPAKKGGAWTESRLHDFGIDGSVGCNYYDGELPVTAVTLVGSTLYGSTRGGGAKGCGTAFSLTLGASPVYTRLYTFGQTATDACSPQAPLRVSGTGVIYGSTVQGGSAPASTECPYGCGTLFSLTPSDGSFTEAVLYSFTGGLDGSEPRTNLLGTPGKTLRGVASHGGFVSDTMEPDYSSYGVLFQLK